jgi:hypothetical protein
MTQEKKKPSTQTQKNWENYAHYFIPVGTSLEVKEELRRAFYYGADALLIDQRSTEKNKFLLVPNKDMLEAVELELDEFKNALLREGA